MEEKEIKLYQDEINEIRKVLNKFTSPFKTLDDEERRLVWAIMSKLEYKETTRYFREHRGGLEESMKTCKKVFDLKDIADSFRANTNFGVEYWKNFRIDPKGVDDSERLSSVWIDTHYVLADMTYPGQESTVVVGMCNFYEEGVVE